MATEKAQLSAESLQSEQSLYDNKYSYIDVYEHSEDDHRFLIAKLDDVCFC